jgi:hypothetical protein
LHGDFSFNNVLVNTRYDDIVILDWQMAEMDGVHATFGTSYFDIACFLANLFNRPLHHCPFGNSITETAELFLDSYAQISCAEFDSCSCTLYLKKFWGYLRKCHHDKWMFSRKVLLVAHRYYWHRYLTQSINQKY